jgi:fibronectin-binding autotransporter adhesin
MRHPSLTLRAAVGGILVLGLSTVAPAAIKYWDVNGSDPGIGGTGIWDATTANWSDDAAGTNPAGAVDWSHFGGSGGTVTIASGATVFANSVTIDATGYTIAGQNSSSTLRLVPNGVIDLDVDAVVSAILTGTGELRKTGAGMMIKSAGFIGTSGAGTTAFNIEEGTVRIDGAGILRGGNFMVYRAKTNGTLHINVNNSVDADNVRFEADGGLINFDNHSLGRPIYHLIAKNGGQIVGSLTPNGGANADLIVRSASSNPAFLTVDNGTIDTQGGDLIVERQTATLTVIVNNGGVIATRAGNMVLTRTAGSSTMVPSVETTAGTTNLISGNLHLTGANDNAYGTVISERTFNVTGTTGTVALEVSAVISNGAVDGASLRKTGTGLLKLSGDNTYTGRTTVAGGVLELTGTLATSDIVVDAGASLIGNGGTIVFTPGDIIDVNGSMNLAGLTFDLLGLSPAPTVLVDYTTPGASVTGFESLTTLGGFNIIDTGSQIIATVFVPEPAGATLLLAGALTALRRRR